MPDKKQQLQHDKDKLEGQKKPSQLPPGNEPEGLPSNIAEFVDLYNENPDYLNKYAHVQVSGDEESFTECRNNNKYPLILKVPESGSSSYLIVFSEKESQHFLFPKSNTVSKGQSEMIKILFDCHESSTDKTSKFILEKPAQVQPNSNNDKEWRFEKEGKGVLKF